MPYQPSPPSCPGPSEAQRGGGEQERGEDRQDAEACHSSSVPEHDGVEVLRLDRPERRNALRLGAARRAPRRARGAGGRRRAARPRRSRPRASARCARARTSPRSSTPRAASPGWSSSPASTRRSRRSRRRRSRSAWATSWARAPSWRRAATCASAATTSSSRGPGAKLGVPVGPARLVPLVGLSKAKELVLTGRVVGMEEAAALGLLHRTAPAAEAEAPRWSWPREIAAHPPEGLRRLKRMFRELGDGRAARRVRERQLRGLPARGRRAAERRRGAV